MKFKIELRDAWNDLLEVHWHDGPEMEARQRTADLAQEKDAAKAFLYNAETGRELYGLIGKRVR